MKLYEVTDDKTPSPEAIKSFRKIMLQLDSVITKDMIEGEARWKKVPGHEFKTANGVVVPYKYRMGSNIPCVVITLTKRNSDWVVLVDFFGLQKVFDLNEINVMKDQDLVEYAEIMKMKALRKLMSDFEKVFSNKMVDVGSGKRVWMQKRGNNRLSYELGSNSNNEKHYVSVNVFKKGDDMVADIVFLVPTKLIPNIKKFLPFQSAPTQLADSWVDTHIKLEKDGTITRLS